ncbi:hypothetical protein KP509_17G044000 [Ceratopteris richardii]|uniref:Band 7 domain-containing protein n=1 Tax=Ceratopteris richardii TaxID=49495 RepID=A0A8T2SWF4_CERRI|nr:hypothetical protein KP509_17G043900 [Ceratopteris richardii]KAH7373205.1 hypothetical protein KP509_17G044000 [Ceratopteris richardii]
MGQLLCCVQVNQASVGIRERWGKYEEALEPGCHCVFWCFGSNVAGTLTMRVQQLDVHCETKTKDNVFVTIVASIQYTVVREHAKEAYYKLSRIHCHHHFGKLSRSCKALQNPNRRKM